MPALEGFADVGQRLSAVRRRVNRLTLLDTVCGLLAAVALLATALVAVGVRGSGPAFRLTVGAGLAGLAVTVAGAALYARRRWVDLATAAGLADRRGNLSDRLTTLATLPPDGSASPLAPLLVTQALTLHDRWRPETVAPRRLPRGALALLAALLVLGATLAFLRAKPLARLAQQRSTGASTAAVRGADSPDRPQPPRSLPGGDRAADTGPENTTASTRGQVADPASGDDVDEGRALDVPESAANPLVALPAQLQNAIRAAVRGEAAGRPHRLAATERRSPGDAANGEADSADANRTGAQAEGTPRTWQDVAAGRGRDADKQPPTETGPQQSGATNRSGEARPGRPGQPGHEGDNTPPSGSAPPAGTGSSAANLLGAKPGGTAAGTQGSASFKVTITSFLKALDQQPSTQRPAGRHAGPGAAPRTAPTLSDTQLADDLLRKAEVPPEYEELVRRVYSTREEP